MADVKYSVDVDTDPAVRALGRFNEGVTGLEGGLRSLGGGGALGKLGFTLAGLGGAAGLGGLIARGFRFNQTLGDSEVAIANVLAQFQGLNQEASKQEAAKAIAKLVELEPKTAGTLADLTGGLLATLAAAQSAGISLEDNIDLVGKFANALANANLPAEQLAQEMRSILTGNIGADSSLAKVLNISNEDVKKAQAAGTLVEFLNQKIGKLGTAGDTAGVAFSTLSSAVDKVAGALAQGLFDDAVQGAKDLSVSLEQNRDLFVALGQGIATFSKGALGLAKTTNEVATGLGTLGAAAVLFFQGEDAVTAFDLATSAAAERMAGLGETASTSGRAVVEAVAPAVAEVDKLTKALENAKNAQQTQAAAAASGDSADTDGDGIVSKREQRRADLDLRRRTRRANAVGRNTGIVNEDFLGVTENLALNAIDLTGPREGARSFVGRDAIRTAARAVRGGAFGVADFPEDLPLSAGARDRRAFERLNEALVPPDFQGGSRADRNAAPLTSAEITQRLDAVVAELKKLNETGQ